MITLTPVCTHRFDGAVELSDLAIELHYGLTLCIEHPRLSEPAGDRGYCIIVEFQNTLRDSTPDEFVRDMLTGHIGWREYPGPTDIFDQALLNPVAYAALLLATRYLRKVVAPNLVARDNLAIHLPLPKTRPHLTLQYSRPL
jgi:hypothetical protein